MSNELHKVEGHPGLRKDPVTGSIVNVDDHGFRAAKEAKKRILEAKKKEKELESRVEKLESLLEQLLKDKQDG